MIPVDLDQYVHVGKVTKPHGIRGEVKILAFSGDSKAFQSYEELVLVDSRKRFLQGTVLKCRSQGRFAVVVLKDVTTRNQAEELAGSEVWVAESFLPELDDSEFYWRDVMNGPVTTKDGQLIGTLINLFDAGGTDMMVVQTDQGEVLIPGQAEFIVDMGESGLVVDVPPGLLEINEKE
jgi:16S rRNA processing protein RimM